MWKCAKENATSTLSPVSPKHSCVPPKSSANNICICFVQRGANTTCKQNGLMGFRLLTAMIGAAHQGDSRLMKRRAIWQLQHFFSSYLLNPPMTFHRWCCHFEVQIGLQSVWIQVSPHCYFFINNFWRIYNRATDWICHLDELVHNWNIADICMSHDWLALLVAKICELIQDFIQFFLV